MADDEEVADKEEEPEDQEDDNDDRIPCEECGKRLPKNAMKRHMMKHEVDNLGLCNVPVLYKCTVYNVSHVCNCLWYVGIVETPTMKHQFC